MVSQKYTYGSIFILQKVCGLKFKSPCIKNKKWIVAVFIAFVIAGRKSIPKYGEYTEATKTLKLYSKICLHLIHYQSTFQKPSKK